MQLDDFLDSIKDLPNDKLERKLNSLVRKNHNFRNLSSENREVILDLVKKYKNRIRRGLGISQYTINKELHRLYKTRHAQDLSEQDREQIKDILESFKK